MATPDAFPDEPTNALIAVASPVVPAFAYIMFPPIIPPMEMGVDPIRLFITPRLGGNARVQF